MAEAAAKEKSTPIAPITALILIVLATAFLFPGISPFINDEPQVLLMAVDHNHQPSEFLGIHLPFTPASVGLQGTRGFAYGPIAAWIDQILLGMTNDPIKMTAIRSFCFSTLLAIALVWLTRTMNLSPWYAPISMLGPWLWFWSRCLGDGSLCIPFSAMTIAAYAAFIATRRPWTIALCILFLWASVMAHLFAVSLLGAMTIHFFLFHRSAPRKIWRAIATTGAACTLVTIPYLIAAIKTYSPTQFTTFHTWEGWWFPLLGGHHLTAGSDWLISNRGQMPALFGGFQAITLLPHLAVWSGMTLAIIRTRNWLSRNRQFSTPDHLALFCLLTAICQGLLDGFEGVKQLPHYLSATWAAYLLLAWYAIDALCRWTRKPRLIVGIPIAAYALSSLGIITITLATLHHDGGTVATDFGTNLSEQIRAVQQIQQFSDQSPLDIQYGQWRLYGWSYQVLLKILNPPPAPRPTRNLLIQYRREFANDAHIEVEAQ